MGFSDSGFRGSSGVWDSGGGQGFTLLRTWFRVRVWGLWSRVLGSSLRSTRGLRVAAHLIPLAHDKLEVCGPTPAGDREAQEAPALGINTIEKLLRTPCSNILFFYLSQSHKLDGLHIIFCGYRHLG